MDTALTDYFGTIGKAAWATVKGLRVTLVTLLRPAVTVQYPDEKLRPYPGYRGALAYDTGACKACGLCVKACPSACIQLEAAVDDQGKRTGAAWFSIDFGKCNFCRLCEESCLGKPKGLWHTLDYELVFSSRGDMVRYWKPGFGPFGRVFDQEKGDFVEPKGQIHVQEPPERR
jgi:formate hydrogenlyase subunit 6/NADH:ubiquinone oxidoreductase subunit I